MSWDEDACYETSLDIPSGKYGKLIAIPGGPGPSGPAGPAGPVGPAGPPGDGDLDFGVMDDKVTPADTDQLVIGEGSARAYTTKKTSWANIKAALKAFFDPTYEAKVNKGVKNGYASLDAATRLPAAQLPISAVEYKGTWNAATNTPTLSNDPGFNGHVQGDMYRVNTGGTQLGVTVAAGDVVFFDGFAWHKLGAADAVTYQVTSQKGVANGYASLDSGGKVPVAQLPSTLMEYKGVWNAATNTPALANGTGNTGDVYRVSTAGTQFGVAFEVGDYAIYNGTVWEKSDTTDSVVSVAGKTGVVTLVKADVGLPLVDNTADASKNVLSASKLTTPRTINGVAFDGTANIAVPVNSNDPVLAGYQLKSEKAAANGYASLDATTRLPAAQLPLSAVEYKGVWNAATNTPALADGTGNLGDMYRVSVAGVQAGVDFAVGDVILYDGSNWRRMGGGYGVFEKVANKGVNNGYASLDSAGKLPASQLPLSALEYKGVWNAATNTPALQADVGTQGDMWRVNASGVQFGVQFTAGDFALFNGTRWENATSGTAGVSSVTGLVGDVSAQPLKVNLDLEEVDNTRDIDKNVLAASRLTTARTINGVGFDGTANITVPSDVRSVSGTKTTPVDADEFGVADSADTWKMKRLSFGNLKATLGSWYDSAVRTLSNKTLVSPTVTSGISVSGTLNLANNIMQIAAVPRFYQDWPDGQLRWSIGNQSEPAGLPTHEQLTIQATNKATNAFRTPFAFQVDRANPNTGWSQLNLLANLNLSSTSQGYIGFASQTSTALTPLPSSGMQMYCGPNNALASALVVNPVGADEELDLDKMAADVGVPRSALRNQMMIRDSGGSQLVETRGFDYKESVSTLTVNSNYTTVQVVTAQAGALTIAETTGSEASPGQRLVFILRDNGVAQTITWNAQFAATGCTLPTKTVPRQWMVITCVAGGAPFTASTVIPWHVLSVSTEANPVVTAADSQVITNKVIDFNKNTMLNFPTGGGGTQYVLPVASTTVLGGVKQGTGTVISADGTISATAATPYVLPPATAGVLGGVKQGPGTSISADGTISSTGLVSSVAGRTGAVTLTKADVGLNLADNTADSAKSVASAAKLTTARTINGVAFDGTANIAVADDTKEPVIDPGTTAQYLRGDKSWQPLNASAVSGAVKGSQNGTSTGLTLWTGTKGQFDAIATKDPKTVYVVTATVAADPEVTATVAADPEVKAAPAKRTRKKAV